MLCILAQPSGIWPTRNKKRSLVVCTRSMVTGWIYLIQHTLRMDVCVCVRCKITALRFRSAVAQHCYLWLPCLVCWSLRVYNVDTLKTPDALYICVASASARVLKTRGFSMRVDDGEGYEFAQPVALPVPVAAGWRVGCDVGMKKVPVALNHPTVMLKFF